MSNMLNLSEMLAIDANEYVKVGKRNSPTECPLALATLAVLKEAKQDIQAVSVKGDKMTLFWKDGTTYDIPIAEDVQEEIKKFDETGEANFEKIVLGGTLDVVLDGLLSGEKHEFGSTYRRKEEA